MARIGIMPFTPQPEGIEEVCTNMSGEYGSTRGRLISVINILAARTDENVGLTAREIADCIGEGCGVTPSENAVLGDLHAIAKGRPLGLDISTPHKGENTGFRCLGRPITPNEATVLIDTVRSCAFISPAQRDTLCAKLEALIPTWKRSDYLATAYIDERNGYQTADIFNALSVISRAISRNERVSFHIVSHLMNGSETLTGLIEEDPVAIVFSYGRYYLETVRKDAGGNPAPLFRRLDRMRAVMTSGRPIEHPHVVEQLRSSTSSDVIERIDMLGEGPTRLLALKVKGPYAKYIYDRFGHNVTFFDIDESEAVGFACVKVRLSQTLYRWLIGMCGGIILVAPTVRIQRHLIETGLAQAPAPGESPLSTRLLEDYTEARKGLEQLVSQASTIYGNGSDGS